MADDDIKSSSPAFLFGQVLTEIKTLKEGQTKLLTVLTSLPDTSPICQERKTKLKEVENWQLAHDLDVKESKQAAFTWYHGLIMLGMTALMSIITGLVLRALM